MTSCTGLYDRCSTHDLHDHTHIHVVPFLSSPFIPFSKAGLDANKNGVDAKSKNGVNTKRGKIYLSVQRTGMTFS